ncbi:uncharacterized protein AMSG_03627 [Thecamonas trahens ATCC 50062]|uniref:Uncharacterized protein n=1 Tax=Thecamonas trahens ATCC 50062 TaxID=461836 RepID=A0A0L0D7B7_THETB|nr:hypothetical protein AMSG_03627 [Thecamonas trahens ATCC 50062]KNC47198.1 hypothetical protein AMSG_03627 [Thecamonas trahens ATCC 50062]|eukprot:XP_013759969.1 hypothetical protein AMSG_03627 [Thecamonas trahens ATCC 50062]
MSALRAVVSRLVPGRAIPYTELSAAALLVPSSLSSEADLHALQVHTATALHVLTTAGDSPLESIPPLADVAAKCFARHDDGAAHIAAGAALPHPPLLPPLARSLAHVFKTRPSTADDVALHDAVVAAIDDIAAAGCDGASPQHIASAALALDGLHIARPDTASRLVDAAVALVSSNDSHGFVAAMALRWQLDTEATRELIAGVLGTRPTSLDDVARLYVDAMAAPSSRAAAVGAALCGNMAAKLAEAAQRSKPSPADIAALARMLDAATTKPPAAALVWDALESVDAFPAAPLVDSLLPLLHAAITGGINVTTSAPVTRALCDAVGPWLEAAESGRQLWQRAATLARLHRHIGRNEVRARIVASLYEPAAHVDAPTPETVDHMMDVLASLDTSIALLDKHPPLRAVVERLVGSAPWTAHRWPSWWDDLVSPALRLAALNTLPNAPRPPHAHALAALARCGIDAPEPAWDAALAELNASPSATWALDRVVPVLAAAPQTGQRARILHRALGAAANALLVPHRAALLSRPTLVQLAHAALAEPGLDDAPGLVPLHATRIIQAALGLAPRLRSSAPLPLLASASKLFPDAMRTSVTVPSHLAGPVTIALHHVLDARTAIEVVPPAELVVVPATRMLSGLTAARLALLDTVSDLSIVPVHAPQLRRAKSRTRLAAAVARIHNSLPDSA